MISIGSLTIFVTILTVDERSKIGARERVEIVRRSLRHSITTEQCVIEEKTTFCARCILQYHIVLGQESKTIFTRNNVLSCDGERAQKIIDCIVAQLRQWDLSSSHNL